MGKQMTGSDHPETCFVTYLIWYLVMQTILILCDWLNDTNTISMSVNHRDKSFLFYFYFFYLLLFVFVVMETCPMKWILEFHIRIRMPSHKQAALMSSFSITHTGVGR